MKAIITSFLVLVLLIIFISEYSFAYPGGITGRTLKTSTVGCGIGSCHSQNTAITGYFTAPDTVIAGQSYTVSITLQTSGGSGGYGVNIAAKTGALAIISGQGLKLLSGELTQSSAISYVATKVIQFTYTAPSSAGSDTLYGTINRGYSGRWYWAPNKGMVVKLASGIINSEVPVNYYLTQNFPNPFNPVTQINYGIMKSSNVKISVYDLLGKEVSTLVNEFQTAGNYSASFNASNFSSGVYFYKIETSDFSEMKKMSLIK
jgi:hypothetical protein